MQYNKWAIAKSLDPSNDKLMDFLYEYVPQKQVLLFDTAKAAADYANENIGAGKSAVVYLGNPKNLDSVIIQRRPS